MYCSGAHMDQSTSARWSSPSTKTVKRTCFIQNEKSGGFPAFPSDEVVERHALSGYRGKRIKGVMHPCVHTQERWIGRQIRMNSGSDRFTAFDVPDGLGGPSPLGMAYTTAMGAAGASQLRDQLSGGMTMAVNLPLFAIEAEQTITIIPQILKSGAKIAAALGPKLVKEIGVRETRHGVYASRRHNVSYIPRTKRAHRFLKEVANIHLLDAFGISPLITDLKALWGATSSVIEHVKRLRELDSNSWSPFSAGYTPVAPMTLTPFVRMKKGGATGIQQDVIDKSLFCRVHAQIRPNGPLPQDLISQCARDFTGVRNPFGLLYELKSFSFALDWVLPMGDLMSKLDSDLRHYGEQPFLQTRRLCWTSKASAVRNFSCATYYVSQPQFLGTLIQSEFRRGLGLPVYEVGQLSLSNVGIRQVLLSTSLILQRT